MIIYDRATVTSRQITDEGYLKVGARISRTGIQKYLRSELGLDGDPNALVSIYRSPEEVFDDASIASLKMIPVTVDHPPGGVSAETFRQHTVGFTADNVRRDGEFVRADLTIMDKRAVEIAQNDKSELSVGYAVEYRMQSGVAPDGQAYDGSQKKIRGNHIALVDAGRCGPECRIDDSKAVVVHAQDCDCASENNGETPMTGQNDPIMVDSIPIRTLDEAVDAIKRLLDQADADRKVMIEARKEIRDAQDRHRAEIRALEDKLAKEHEKTSDQAISDRADALTNVRFKASPYLPAAYDFSGKTAIEIAKDTLQKAGKGPQIADRSDDYIMAVFDGLDDEPPANPIVDHIMPKKGAPKVGDARAAYAASLSTAYRGGEQKGAA